MGETKARPGRASVIGLSFPLAFRLCARMAQHHTPSTPNVAFKDLASWAVQNLIA